MALDINRLVLCLEDSSNQLQLEVLDSIVARGQVLQDRPLYSQIEAEFITDKVQPIMIVLRTRCLRFRSKGIFSKFPQFLSVPHLPKICKGSAQRWPLLAKLASSQSR